MYETINIYSTCKNGFETLSNILNGEVREEINSTPNTFKTVEHAYQCKKAIFFGDINMANKIFQSNTGWDAQRLSKLIIRDNDLAKEWDKISSLELEKSMRLCFEQNPKAVELLLKTENATLIHDSGKHINLGKWATIFPEILTKIRDENCK